MKDPCRPPVTALFPHDLCAAREKATVLCQT